MISFPFYRRQKSAAHLDTTISNISLLHALWMLISCSICDAVAQKFPQYCISWRWLPRDIYWCGGCIVRNCRHWLPHGNCSGKIRSINKNEKLEWYGNRKNFLIKFVKFVELDKIHKIYEKFLNCILTSEGDWIDAKSVKEKII